MHGPVPGPVMGTGAKCQIPAVWRVSVGTNGRSELHLTRLSEPGV